MRICLSIVLVVLLGFGGYMVVEGKQKIHEYVTKQANSKLKEQILKGYPNAAKLLKIDEKTDPKVVVSKALSVLNSDVHFLQNQNKKLRQENSRLKAKLQQKQRNIKGMFN